MEAATDEVIDVWAAVYEVLTKVCIEREAAIYTRQAEVEGGWNGYRRVIADAKICDLDRILQCA